MFGSYEEFYSYLLYLIPDDTSFISWSPSANNTKAIYFFCKQSAITLKLSGKVRYLSISASILKEPEEISPKYELAEKGKSIRFPLDLFNNEIVLSALPTLINDTYEYYKKHAGVETFGCCNDFIRCSDAKMCLHRNDYSYLGCQYRQNLESGRIFYGKNRNIDDTTKNA